MSLASILILSALLVQISRDIEIRCPALPPFPGPCRTRLECEFGLEPTQRNFRREKRAVITTAA